jgi:hypothetical protein
LGLGGTALSNPMKSFAQIESLLLKATPVDGGYVVNGTLPWVSNLAARPLLWCHCRVVMDGQREARSVMFILKCDAHRACTLQELPQASRPWRAPAPGLLQLQRPFSSGRTTSLPTRPNAPLHPQHPCGLRDAAMRHGGGHHRRGAIDSACGRWKTNWAM